MPRIYYHRNITFQRLMLDFIQFILAQKALTRFVGPQFSRSQTRVEIDLTYRCNLRCENCNRSCTQAPSRLDIPLERVAGFIDQSVSMGLPWERIRLLGGEPTLYPQIDEVVALLLDYKRNHRPGLRIVICTNGDGRKVNDVLNRLPGVVEIKKTPKGSPQPLFRPFNMAPVDNIMFRWSDFSAGCRIIRDCGLGLTPMGYYPCAVAGGIDRVFGWGLGRPDLPSKKDDMRDLMRIFCRYCGHFGFLWPSKRQKMSNAWRKAYLKYRPPGETAGNGFH